MTEKPQNEGKHFFDEDPTKFWLLYFPYLIACPVVAIAWCVFAIAQTSPLVDWPVGFGVLGLIAGVGFFCRAMSSED